MRAVLSIIIAAGLTAGSLAQNSAGGSAAAQPGTTAVQPPAPPPTPKGITVPEMPVIKTTELEGGLVIEDMKIGEGYEVQPGGAVVAHYHGTLKEGGKVFDSSFERGEPLVFPLNGVIQGWQKGVPGMKVGGIRRLTVPAAMGYGAAGAGEDIPPNSDLIFIIQLVDALQIEDLKEGTGEAATGQCVAVTTHTIKDKDGKEIEKVEAANPYIWFPGELEGIQFGIEGMKVGGKRRLSIPKEMNIANPQLQSARPSEVPMVIELDLIAMRNLPTQRRR
ncbi:MAG: FKBP-type peptidyl-prolyl cis-trans isomerase [Phycisphaerales bacterium]|nr:FKBP-type peptidyl-prolyl cis-trans isomerase [Phycisphaerales bacterium]